MYILYCRLDGIDLACFLLRVGLVEVLENDFYSCVRGTIDFILKFMLLFFSPSKYLIFQPFSQEVFTHLTELFFMLFILATVHKKSGANRNYATCLLQAAGGSAEAPEIFAHIIKLRKWQTRQQLQQQKLLNKYL